ncbi:hypothetical protein MMC28_009541 [Mycoblastus sanguinarius]|nr:hypothetical protein [Mycoblastus sanguinarius]
MVFWNTFSRSVAIATSLLGSTQASPFAPISPAPTSSAPSSVSGAPLSSATPGAPFPLPNGTHTYNPTASGSGMLPFPTSSSSPASSRNKCSPDTCGVCSQNNSTGNATHSSTKRSNSHTGKHASGLSKRFFEAPQGQGAEFTTLLLEEPYTENLSEGPTSYVWHDFDDEEYAAAIEGLCGCTAVFAMSHNGAFSSHLFENDPHTLADLQPANYQNTMAALNAQLGAHQADLQGGSLFVMIPVNPENLDEYLYDEDDTAIAPAILNTVQQASGLVPHITTYDPLDCDNAPESDWLGRGTAAAEYDPEFNDNGVTKRAWRVYFEEDMEGEDSWQV